MTSRLCDFDRTFLARLGDELDAAGTVEAVMTAYGAALQSLRGTRVAIAAVILAAALLEVRLARLSGRDTVVSRGLLIGTPDEVQASVRAAIAGAVHLADGSRRRDDLQVL